jgi:xyloglucan-specific endo-beta-1,4-glucanase
MKVYSFVRSGSNDTTSFKADVKLFFNYLVSNQQFPASSQNLIGEQYYSWLILFQHHSNT